jgi:hypothetical protein
VFGLATHPIAPGFRPFQVSAIDHESAGVLSFSMLSNDGQPLPIAVPGQYVVLCLQPSANRPPLFRSLQFAKTSGEAKNGAILGGVGVNAIIASVQRRLWRGRARVCVECTYTKDRRKSVRARLLDRNNGVTRRFASEKESDPKPRNESYRSVSLSQIRDAFGPHGNENTRRAIVSDGVHSVQPCGPAPPNAGQQRATDPAGVKEIDRLLDHHTYLQIVSILNERGLRSGVGQMLSVRIV